MVESENRKRFTFATSTNTPTTLSLTGKKKGWSLPVFPTLLVSQFLFDDATRVFTAAVNALLGPLLAAAAGVMFALRLT